MVANITNREKMMLEKPLTDKTDIDDDFIEEPSFSDAEDFVDQIDDKGTEIIYRTEIFETMICSNSCSWYAFVIC